METKFHMRISIYLIVLIGSGIGFYYGSQIYPKEVSCEYSEIISQTTLCEYPTDLLDPFQNPPLEYCWENGCRGVYPIVTQECILHNYTVIWEGCSRDYSEYYLDGALPPYLLNATCYFGMDCSDDPFDGDSFNAHILTFISSCMLVIVFLFGMTDMLQVWGLCCYAYPDPESPDENL